MKKLIFLIISLIMISNVLAYTHNIPTQSSQVIKDCVNQQGNFIPCPENNKKSVAEVRDDILDDIEEDIIKSNRIEVQTALIQRLRENTQANEIAIEKITKSLNRFIERINQTNLTKDKLYNKYEVIDASFGATQITKIQAKEKVKLFGFIPVTVTDVFELNENGDIINNKVSVFRVFIIRR